MSTPFGTGANASGRRASSAASSGASRACSIESTVSLAERCSAARVTTLSYAANSRPFTPGACSSLW